VNKYWSNPTLSRPAQPLYAERHEELYRNVLEMLCTAS
jgi:hypothetical protein